MKVAVASLFLLLALALASVRCILAVRERDEARAEARRYRVELLASRVQHGDRDEADVAVKEAASDSALERVVLSALKRRYRTEEGAVPGWRVKQRVDMERWALRDYYRAKWRLVGRGPDDPDPASLED